MIELYIDNRPVEITEETTVAISARADELAAPESVVRKEYAMRIPMSRHNRSVLQFAEQALSAHRYNQSGHTGEIRCRGTTLLRGDIELIRCEIGGASGGEYVIVLAVEPPQWIREAKSRRLSDIELPLEAVLSEEWIIEGWSSECPVKYLPVWRDREDPAPLERLSLADYHPFVQIAALLEAIVAPSGYRIVSEFFDGPFFRSLCMSGNFSDGKLLDGVAAPQLGEAIALKDVFYHSAPQIDLWRAVGHLFDLHTVTDEQTKTIYAEPRGALLNREGEIDWSGRIDPEKPVVLEEPGRGRNRTERFRYRAGDGVLDRGTPPDAAPCGSWSAQIHSRLADDRPKDFTNALFTASADVAGRYAWARSASLVAVGDRDGRRSPREGYLDFPAKIVRYLGRKPLPPGEYWGWPSDGMSYPMAVFHAPAEDGHTLRFDDPAGLKNYYRSRYDGLNGGKILTLHLRLTPSEAAALLCRDSDGRDFRGNFVFTLRGEKLRGRLAGIDGYDPAAGSTRCVFTLEP